MDAATYTSMTKTQAEGAEDLTEEQKNDRTDADRILEAAQDRHRFKGESHEWTEVFTTLGEAGREPATLAALRSADYHGAAIPAVDAWMDSVGIGSKNSSATAS